LSVLSYPYGGSSSYPRTRVSSLLLLLAALLVASTSALAYSIPVPDFPLLERQLRIRPSQKAQFDTAVAASQRALMSVAIAGLQVKERLSRELDKPLPDLHALYRLHEEAADLTLPNFREASREWERLFAMLDRSQVDALKRFLRDQLSFLSPNWQ
jgi:hypothetical protein